MLVFCPMHLKLRLGGGDIVPVEGFKMRLDPTRYEDRAYWFMPHRYDATERRIVLQKIPHDTSGWLIDVGANIGFITLWLATRFPNARVLSIDAAPETFQRLKEHLELNQITNVVPVQVGVLDTYGKLPFHYSSAYCGRSSFMHPVKAPTKDETQKVIEVDVIPLADLFQKYTIERCELMKMDIEGAEERVLRHFFEHVPTHAHPKLLWVEYIHNPALSELIQSYGYRAISKSRMNIVFEKTP